MNIPSSFDSAKLGNQELRRIAAQLQKISGIELPSEKASLVQARLSKRLRTLELKSYSEYCDLLESPSGQKERAELLSALTTNVTKFFRENHHFKFLESNILPKILEETNKSRPIKIWSAACSTGEEPYSIAMTILKMNSKSLENRVKIYATDIDPKVVEHAEKGSYRIYPDGPVSQSDIKNYFEETPEKDVYVARKKMKDMISFSTLNLHDEWPSRGDFDVIFCRNVVIYFSKERENKIWQKFDKILRPGGYLFIGHSERVPAETSCKLKLDGVTTYVSEK